MRRTRPPNFFVIGTYETISDDDDNENVDVPRDDDGSSTTSPPHSTSDVDDDRGLPLQLLSVPHRSSDDRRYVRDEGVQASEEPASVNVGLSYENVLGYDAHASRPHWRPFNNTGGRSASPTTSTLSPTRPYRGGEQQQRRVKKQMALPDNIARLVAESHSKVIKGKGTRRRRSPPAHERKHGSRRGSPYSGADGAEEAAVLDPVLHALQASQRQAARMNRAKVADWVDGGRNRRAESPSTNHSHGRDRRREGAPIHVRVAQEIDDTSSIATGRTADTSTTYNDRLMRMERTIEELQRTISSTAVNRGAPLPPSSSSLPPRRSLDPEPGGGAIDKLHETLQEIKKIDEAKPFLDKWREVSEYYAKVAANPSMGISFVQPMMASNGREEEAPLGRGNGGGSFTSSSWRGHGERRELSSSPVRRSKLYEGYTSPFSPLMPFPS